MNFPIQFHVYGLLVGVAVVVALGIVERVLRREKVMINGEAVFIVTILSGIVGARVYHLVTDWALYQDLPWWEIFAIWNGGLGVLGALMGGMVGLLGVLYLQKSVSNLWHLADAVALALPFAQAIGRWGNYFNQELYGKETDVPWGLLIAGQKYHPLFLYESGLMLVGGGVLLLLYLRKVWPFGVGKYFAAYGMYYSLVRFSLEFMRLETAQANWSPISTAQWVCVIFFTVSLCLFFEKSMKKNKVIGAVLSLIFCTAFFSGCSAPATTEGQPMLPTTEVQINGKSYQVEIARTPDQHRQGLSNRKQLGSDGMLFFFDPPARRTFWMKEMQFDLDFIWIKEGVVTEITADVPHPEADTSDSQLQTYTSAQEAEMMLEVVAGFAKREGIKVGDAVDVKE